MDSLTIGKLYHIKWAKKGCVWRLESFDGEKAVMLTPKTKKRITVNTSDLYDINRNKNQNRA